MIYAAVGTHSNSVCDLEYGGWRRRLDAGSIVVLRGENILFVNLWHI